MLVGERGPAFLGVGGFGVSLILKFPRAWCTWCFWGAQGAHRGGWGVMVFLGCHSIFGVHTGGRLGCHTVFWGCHGVFGVPRAWCTR